MEGFMVANSTAAAIDTQSASYRQAVLEMVPQREPFRFIDEIIELDSEHIVAAVEFKEDADFYRGHFPDRPITPGVILLEAMAQAAVVAFGVHLVAEKHSLEHVGGLLSLFTDADVEFSAMVKPGQRVITTGKKVYYRHRKLRASAEMRLEDGTLVCAGTLSGFGVPA